jgi:flavin-dependent dehydrogenase
MWGISRGAMDAALLDAARDAGVRVLQPARCESLNDLVTVRHLPDNRLESLRSDWIILADGKGALLPTRPRPTTDFGIKAHFADVAGPRDAVELFGVQGHYVGLAPIEAALSNVAFSISAKRLQPFSQNLDALWRLLLTENPTLAARFTGARRASDWLASPLPRFGVAKHWPPNVIPIGNAAAALEPIGGEGMGLALRSAELAADALHESHSTGVPFSNSKLQRDFRRLWRTRRLACRALAKLLSHPPLAGPLLDWATTNGHLPRAALALIGKT